MWIVGSKTILTIGFIMNLIFYYFITQMDQFKFFSVEKINFSIFIIKFWCVNGHVINQISFDFFYRKNFILKNELLIKTKLSNERERIEWIIK